MTALRHSQTGLGPATGGETGPAGESIETGTARLRPDPDATRRAFVVQVGPEAEPGAEGFTGRVQHLATSDGGNFASVEGLIAIMRRVLDRMRRDDDGEDQDGKPGG